MCAVKPFVVEFGYIYIYKKKKIFHTGTLICFGNHEVDLSIFWFTFLQDKIFMVVSVDLLLLIKYIENR